MLYIFTVVQYLQLLVISIMWVYTIPSVFIGVLFCAVWLLHIVIIGVGWGMRGGGSLSAAVMDRVCGAGSGFRVG